MFSWRRRLEEKRDRNFEGRCNRHEAARTDAVDARFVFVDLLEAYSERRCQACLADPQYLASRPDAGAYRNRIGFFVSGGQNPSLRDGLRTQHYTCPERQDNRQTDISLDGGMAGPVLRLSSAGGLVPSRFSSLRRWATAGFNLLADPTMQDERHPASTRARPCAKNQGGTGPVGVKMRNRSLPPRRRTVFDAAAQPEGHRDGVALRHPARRQT